MFPFPVAYARTISIKKSRWILFLRPAVLNHAHLHLKLFFFFEAQFLILFVVAVFIFSWMMEKIDFFSPLTGELCWIYKKHLGTNDKVLDDLENVLSLMNEMQFDCPLSWICFWICMHHVSGWFHSEQKALAVIDFAFRKCFTFQ